LVVFTPGIFASDKNPADYALTAHVLGVSKHRTAGGITSAYDYKTGSWTYGSYSGSSSLQTELRIGNMTYLVNRICKEVEVGRDYPASRDKKKVHLLLPDGKTCDSTIEEIHETGEQGGPTPSPSLNR
jgi:hypothetical protein